MRKIKTRVVKNGLEQYRIQFRVIYPCGKATEWEYADADDRHYSSCEEAKGEIYRRMNHDKEERRLDKLKNQIAVVTDEIDFNPE